MLKILTRALAGSVVVAASLASSCSSPDVPHGDSPQPHPQCVSGTAVQHAHTLALGIDVSIYDNNDDSRGGCFTSYERAFVDGLRDVQTNHGIEDSVLQRIVDDHRTVGPLTVSALRDHAKGWEFDQAHSDTPFYTGSLGYIVAHEMLPTMLMPGLQAHPSVSGHATKHSYPVNENVYHWLPPRLNNFEDVDLIASETFLTRLGYDQCTLATPEQLVGSLDVVTPDFSINPVYVAWPEPVRLINVIPKQRYDYGIDYVEFTLGFHYEIDPDDRSLLDVDEIVIVFGHMFPREIASSASREEYLREYGLHIGDMVAPYTHVGFNNAVSKMVDISYETPTHIPGAAMNFTNLYVFDLLGAPYSDNPSTMSIRFAEPRFGDVTIHAPCDVDAGSGEWLNLP